MIESETDKVWRLCSELTSAIEECVKSGYRVDVNLETYQMMGWRDVFTIIQANVYKGITARDKFTPASPSYGVHEPKSGGK